MTDVEGFDLRRVWLAGSCREASAGWAYVWIIDGHVAHVGATWMDPAERAAIHLSGHTDDPRSLVLQAAVGGASQTPTVLAFPVPAGATRADYRDALRAACADAGLPVTDVQDGTHSRHEAADAAWFREALSHLVRGE